jgi:P-type Cu+ transporter
MNRQSSCTLCGQTIKSVATAITNQQDSNFCCDGCQMVYAMIMQSDQYKQFKNIKETEIYKKCVAAGVIPNDSTNVTEEKNRSQSKTIPIPDEQRDQSDDATKELLTWDFSITNMWCPACAWVVEDVLKRSKGVVNAVCNFSRDRGKVHYDPVNTTPDTLKKIVENLGYFALSPEDSHKASPKEFVRLAITFFLSMNIMMLSWSIYSGFIWQISDASIQLLSWPILLMATIVLIYGGYPIHLRAWAGIRARTPGMEVLISMGSITAYLYSFFHVFEGSRHLYFDASSMLVVLVLVGKKLEQSAKNRISAGFSEFLSLAPEKVKICTAQFPNGHYVSVKQLSISDTFQVEQGEILAADGIVIKGDAIIDESSISGEPKPLNASINETVKSGSRVMSGSIQVKATAVGSKSVFGKMMMIMENNLSGKTEQTERFEGILRLFVPAVIGFSFLVYLYNVFNGMSSYEAVSRGISVMVISCPCALGIAIPLALTAGVSIARKAGILVRDLEAFESVEGLGSIVFDKTGTLTTGKMQLLDVHTTNATVRKTILGLACALEEKSNHYLAIAVKSYCQHHGFDALPITNIEQHDNGISGNYEGKKLRLGSRQFVGQLIPIVLDINPGAETVQVVSQVYFAVDESVVAVLRFGDSLRKGTKKLITDLQGRSLSTFLVSGDANSPTCSVGQSVGIASDNCYGGRLPHQKADIVKDLKKANLKVAMVGDGINDGPAMAESDLAVAVHSGLNPGEHVSSITLIRKDPAQLIDFLILAREVNRTVKQNLIFAFIYNLIGIPVAASGLLNPIIAVTAMLFSSLSVTFNTLILVNKNIKF